MRHPPYHLRLNKAVDRSTLIEVIRALGLNPPECVYFGFGGPYLEDFRLMYEFFPQMEMFSIEKNEETCKRQRFHLPCRTIKLINRDMKSFLARYNWPNDKKSIVWLDYSDLVYGNFSDFKDILTKVTPESIVKITLRAEPQDFLDLDLKDVEKKLEKFREMFSEFLPNPSKLQSRFLELPYLLQDMLRIASQQALPGDSALMFKPVLSFFYNDNTQMFTLTGVVCRRKEASKIEEALKKWKNTNLRWNLKWNKPQNIDVPILSTKERLYLETILPCSKSPGKTLRKALGYLIDENQSLTEKKLKQYSDFHRYFPYFIRAIP